MRSAPPTAAGVGLLLSGGLDSGILLGHLLSRGRRVQPFYVRSDVVWADAELQSVQSLLAAVGHAQLEPLVVFEMPLADLYDRHWSITGRDIPSAGSNDDAVFLPGRNALLALKPALWCAMHGIGELALAVLASNPFADATEDFFADLETIVQRAMSRRVALTRPFAHLEKKDVMDLGRGLPLEMTFSCIAPVARLHCGRCNKCAERQSAFRAVGMDDPTAYAHRPAAAGGSSP